MHYDVQFWEQFIPKVWKATALSEYVSLTLDLIHSAFSEGATGVGEGGLLWCKLEVGVKDDY